MSNINSVQQSNSNRQMAEAEDYIPLPIVQLTTIKDKTDFIFNKLKINQCDNCVNVNFQTNKILCLIPNCKKFHRSFKNTSYNFRNIEVVMCRYDDHCKMNQHCHCKFIHTEQIQRWYKFYIDNASIYKMINLIFMEISRSIEKHYVFHERKNEEIRQIEEENRIARENERIREEEREREIQSRREADQMRNRSHVHAYSRDRSRSRERLRDRNEERVSYRDTIHNSRSEIERLNNEIEIAKKKKELAELSRLTEISKTQIDISKMVETAINDIKKTKFSCLHDIQDTRESLFQF
jgi:hypothetical protein